MDVSTINYRFREILQHKQARLAVRRRLLFKRTTNHEDPIFKRRRYLLEKEARSLRLLMMQLRQSTHQCQDVTRQEEQLANEINMNEVTHQYRRDKFDRRWEFGPRTVVCPNCKTLMWIEERLSPLWAVGLITVNDGRGPYVYRISGSNYHIIGTLLPEPGSGPNFAQLYIYDTDNETSNRLHYMGGTEASSLDPRILQGLQTMLDDINPYVAVFRNAGSMLRDQGEHQYLRIKLIRAREGKQYIQPTASEVVALMVGDGTEDIGNQDIILQKIDGGLQRIDETHPSYMPLQYPLLFPYGTDGWRVGIPKASSTSTSRSTVTMRQLYAFRIHDREEEGDTLIDSGRLLQQFDVDAYAAMKQYRLSWIRRNQGRLRSDLYSGLQDAIRVGDVNANDVGRLFILPSSFTRSPRNMAHHYQDATAIVRVLGPPDLFITFTCNPNWPEIVNEISTRGSRRTEDRPDIVARVFKIKLKQMLRDLKDNKKFGKVIADFYVIEFQKRGLPHAHILITLAPEDKPKCPEDIDVIISAEIPDKDRDPLAFETVTKNMLHGPCGPCLIDGKCSKHFPKKFCAETTFDDNGFVQYRRRQNREPIIVNGREVDNRWVVPYNRDLCVKYNAHINAERVATRSVVKYLYKYVTKGQDRATIVIENNSTTRRGQEVQQGNRVDEIKQYLDCRYVSAIEACWRIFEFDLQHQYPSTELLQFHLPGEQFVVFNDNDDLHTVLERPRLQQTMLTMWFQANKDFPKAKQYTYQNFPMGFTWIRSTKRWAQRQERPCIEVSDPKQLWEQHWGELTDDLERMMQHFPDMPQPSSELARSALNRLIRDELKYDTHDEANIFDTLVRGLNTDQYRVYAAILDAHSRDVGGLFFVYDSGGTGKTYPWNTLITKFRSERKIVLSVASSGIAALLLPGGKTAHSTFKIPFDPDQHSVCNFKKDSTRADLIREASLIIWDEAPMTHRLAFEAVDRHFKDICSDSRVFGGKLVVLGGDFRQILPVVPDEG
ncbi:uncharacterized protein LOC110730050 [Chenopodium quinoa]|uniref:uncharacterized protein LOC110730050 n=1 Tax=Chenopodium quinoa TaxID=63459 RepID=UPI000B776A42|nr:uncharacterized protein LOC110730050 [Chenopodium quinoa]